MNDFIIWAIVFAILGSAIGYIIIQKRKGVKCVGCASEASCACPKESEHQCACQTNPTQASNCCSKGVMPIN